MITYVRCHTALQAQEMFEAGLLVLDGDCSPGRKRPEYMPASEVFTHTEQIAEEFGGSNGWKRQDFLYIVED